MSYSQSVVHRSPGVPCIPYSDSEEKCLFKKKNMLCLQ